MALVKCNECGNDISTQAKSCPGCGAKPPRLPKKKMSRIVVFFLWLLVVGIIASVMMQPRKIPDTPEQIVEKKALDAIKMKRNSSIESVSSQIRRSMRNPDSLIWESAGSNSDGSVLCFTYRAQNGFGGMTREFAVMTKDKISHLPRDWNKNCQIPLKDVMDDLKYFESDRWFVPKRN